MLYNEIMKHSLTPKQQKLVILLKQELSNKNGSRTLAEMMIQAGYSPKTAESPSGKVLNSPAVKEATQEFVDMLDEKARMAFGLINAKKLQQESSRDRAYVADILVKNKQLLSGKETERMSINIEISEEIAKKNL